ncbi:hypothetical protein As57867_014838, partial [Aphanomyces stellatus]
MAAPAAGAALRVLQSPTLLRCMSVFQRGRTEAMQQGMREMRLWRPIVRIYGRLHVNFKRQVGTKPLEEIPVIMMSRRAILDPWFHNADDRARLYDLVASDNAVLAAVAEYAAFYGLVDVLQTIHERAIARREDAELDAMNRFCVFGFLPSLYQLAAFHGHIPVAQFLGSTKYQAYNAYGCFHHYSDLEIAVERSQLTYVEFVHAAYRKPPDGTFYWGHSGDLANYHERSRLSALDAAAANGHLELVRFLHGHGVQCTTFALDQAATNGHLDVVRFLVEHCKRCTTDAMDGAAANGHFNIVQFLQAKRTEGCTSNAMDDAAFHGHTDIVRFLHSFYPDEGGCTVEVMNAYASRGDLAMVEWLDVHRLEKCSPRALNGA